MTAEQLASNLSAIELAATAGGWPGMAEPPRQYWSRRSLLAWR